MFTGICILLIAVSSVQFTNGATTKKQEDISSAIVYPGKIQDISNRYGTTSPTPSKGDEDIPEECKNKNYCTIKPANYPQNRFNDMFKGTKTVSQPMPIPEFIDNRQGDPDAKDNCETEISYQPLYRVRTKRGDWRTVVQAPEENYVQSVRLETCKEVEGACFTAFPLAPDVKTFCKQKYSVWEFLVSDEKNGTEKVQSELPICCSCHYKTVDMSKRK